MNSKKQYITIILLVFVLGCFSQTYPKIENIVTDNAKIFSQDELNARFKLQMQLFG